MDRPSAAATRRASLLALVALAVDVALPLLPVYGNGHQTIFDVGFPARIVLAQVLTGWSSALAVFVAIVLISRSRAAIAAGAFLAIAIGSGIQVVSQVISTTDVFRRWQSNLVVGLTAAEAILLFIAAASVWRTARAPSRTPLEPSDPAS